MIRACISRRLASKKALLVTVNNGEASAAFSSLKFNSTFEAQLEAAGGLPKAGKVRHFYAASDDYPLVTIVGVCDKNKTEVEGRDEIRENQRRAVAQGVRALEDMGVEQVDIATDGCRQAAGEAASMTCWHYKQDKREKYPTSFTVLDPNCAQCQAATFDKGVTLGEAQNFARELMELPSNLLTPQIFADRAKSELESLGVKVNVYDGDWIQEQNMNAFWSVAKGSSEPPRMVEMIYEGEGASEDNTFCLVGKGVTFDSGGISIKDRVKYRVLEFDFQIRNFPHFQIFFNKFESSE